MSSGQRSAEYPTGDGVDGNARHLAITRKQSQHVGEPPAATAKPRAQGLAMPAVLARRLDRPAERDRFVTGDRRTLLGFGQTGTMRRIYGSGRGDGGDQQTEREEKWGKSGEGRHIAGLSGAPVNAG